jgi:hypothetical protein
LDKKEAEKIGVKAIIEKPVEMFTLGRQIRRLLDS